MSVDAWNACKVKVGDRHMCKNTTKAFLLSEEKTYECIENPQTNRLSSLFS